ncbi:hypothetical protein Cgig2_022866 [Carnegiea gigantea]|uniref:GRF-type domain-containing protein n=1 Tax=Carnegiea gigantea TaxID=171969 RepID=A0A9Q1KR18_9CARY|nr:hypothetical protein Cgig2_022866 [Carnegiea gigantea]
MAAACRNCPCFSVCERCCSCRKRCVVLTSMAIKNPLRRFARCRMYDSPDGCDHFEWVDDSLCDKKMKEEASSDRDAIKRLRKKNSRLKMENSRLKMQLIDYQMREKKVLRWLLLLFGLVIGVGFVVVGERGSNGLKIKRKEVQVEQILETEKVIIIIRIDPSITVIFIIITV